MRILLTNDDGIDAPGIRALHSALMALDPASLAAFGGPIFYGHARRFNERADHPKNIFWHQAKRANEVFAALDGKQREKALIEKAPPEDSITLQGRDGDLL